MGFEVQSIGNDNITARPFKEIPGLWIRLGQMTETFFTKELPRTSVPNTIYGVLIFTGVSTFISVVVTLLGGVINFLTAPAVTKQTELATFVGMMAISLCCFGLIMTPISFYLNNGITYVSALIFGGKGKFSSQAYLGSLFIVPLGFIASLASFISLVPTVGVYLSYTVLLVITIFQLFFTIRTFKVVHNFSTGRAAATVLSPLALILIPICMIGILALMGPAIGNIFSEINSTMP